MNLPSLPTDNLYKFCAVSGLVLLLFGATFPIQKLFETQDDVDNITTESKVLEQKIAFLQEDMQRLEVNVKQLHKDTTAAAAESAAHSHVNNLQSLEARTTEAKNTLGVVRQTSRKLAIASTKVKGHAEHTVHLLRRMWLYLAGAAIFMFGGLALARFGFVRCYYRVQKPADEVLVHRASTSGS